MSRADVPPCSRSRALADRPGPPPRSRARPTRSTPRSAATASPSTFPTGSCCSDTVRVPTGTASASPCVSSRCVAPLTPGPCSPTPSARPAWSSTRRPSTSAARSRPGDTIGGAARFAPPRGNRSMRWTVYVYLPSITGKGEVNIGRRCGTADDAEEDEPEGAPQGRANRGLAYEDGYRVAENGGRGGPEARGDHEGPRPLASRDRGSSRVGPEEARGDPGRLRRRAQETGTQALVHGRHNLRSEGMARLPARPVRRLSEHPAARRRDGHRRASPDRRRTPAASPRDPPRPGGGGRAFGGPRGPPSGDARNLPRGNRSPPAAQPPGTRHRQTRVPEDPVPHRSPRLNLQERGHVRHIRFEGPGR